MTTKADIKVLDAAIDELVYSPTPEQRRVKSALWAVVAENPAYDAASLTCEDIAKITGDGRVRLWWRDQAFREWFLNHQEFRQRLEFQAHLALDALERILSSGDPRTANAQVQAAKLIIEAASKMPQRWTKEVWADERVQKMDKAQLKEFIKRNSYLLAEAEPSEGDDK